MMNNINKPIFKKPNTPKRGRKGKKNLENIKNGQLREKRSLVVETLTPNKNPGKIAKL